ncbi:hypothetical protein C7S13_6444 [Burkholderia cepacia]|nr:hypothetical protein [Burkholderia cepacia]QOH37687.1 hypothetical protein C7S14_0650 [Burkholderia cepacia]
MDCLGTNGSIAAGCLAMRRSQWRGDHPMHAAAHSLERGPSHPVTARCRESH